MRGLFALLLGAALVLGGAGVLVYLAPDIYAAMDWPMQPRLKPRAPTQAELDAFERTCQQRITDAEQRVLDFVRRVGATGGELRQDDPLERAPDQRAELYAIGEDEYAVRGELNVMTQGWRPAYLQERVRYVIWRDGRASYSIDSPRYPQFDAKLMDEWAEVGVGPLLCRSYS